MTRALAVALGILGAALLVLLLGHLHGCGGTAVQRQASAADLAARAANAGLPAVVAAYERAGRAAIDAACCDRAAMERALEAHDRRWQPVVAAWESVRGAHDVWRGLLESCRRLDASASCTPSLDAAQGAFLRAMSTARCALRAVGRADLDPLPGTPACAGADGGSP